MREIKFRAKDLNGNWVFGFYSPIIWFPTFEQTPSIKTFKGSDVEIDIKTLGQYTGLRDKNNKEIYESDVVRQQSFGSIKTTKYENDKKRKEHIKYLKNKNRCIFDNDTDYHINYDYVVEYKDARFYPFADDNFEWGNYDNNKPVEVIGNIYDNLELLEASNED